MDIEKFKIWRESEDYKKLKIDSNIILYKNYFNGNDDPNDWEWGIWGGRDIWDDLLIENQREYGELNIKRMNVQDILNQNSIEYSYVKTWVLDELENVNLKNDTDEAEILSDAVYTEEEVAKLLLVQRGNCYVAILTETRDESLAMLANNAPEPSGGNWRK